ncbi:MAG TPA: bifunctional diaminohydroxyphosphoribosylaminopyrimidine deaminase/5-amino-6-(5-phosphoribosylamino)uracil reductase RibD [Chitinophagaceae bacterium]
MHRCIELARSGIGYVAPNPMVGAVLVHDNKIIGEGYHEKYGEAHAEVNCINQAIQKGYSGLIAGSTIYVSLEPCAHYGKTPPCADLIIRHKIPKAGIGCRDPFKEVDGKGIEKLVKAGVEVETGILEEECKALNKRFFIFHEQHRPYIILKWAQTADGKIAAPSKPPPKGEAYDDSDNRRLFISNEYTNRLVHKWRSEEASILVGTNTVINDDPELTTRLWPGNSPVRLIVDMHLRLPVSLKVFNQAAPTIIFNTKKHSKEAEWSAPSPSERVGVRLLHYQVTEDVSLVHQVINALCQLKIQSVIVEGGAKLLQSFIDRGMWDEARVIKNSELKIKNGLAAPELGKVLKVSEQKIFSDTIEILKPVS